MGKVSFDEFITAASDRYRLIMGEGHLKYAFDIIDINKDGEISIEELKQCFSYGNLGAGFNTEKAERVDDKMWDELIADIDKNDDGKITFEEFKEHMMGLIPKGKYDQRNRIRGQTEASMSPKA